MDQKLYTSKSSAHVRWTSTFVLTCLLMISGLFTAKTYGQCIQTSPFGTATLSATVSGTATIGCNFAGEYGTWNSAVTGNTYSFSSTTSTDFLTISSVPGGPGLAFGTQPLVWTSTVTGTIYVHVSTNSACGTNSSCRDITGTTTAIFVPGCTNTSPFGTQTLSAVVSGSATIGCNFADEYGTWNGAVTGNTYNFTSTIGTDFLTIHTGSPAGPIVASGTQPLSWVSTVTGTIYVHVNTNSSCGTSSTCRDITGTTTAIFVPGCTNTSPFGTQTLSGTIGGFATIGCNFAGEYGTWNGAQTGYTYNFTSTIGTDYLTIHTGSPAGPIVASGTQPLSWVSTVTGTIYVHVNTNSACGTNSSCRDITGTTTAIFIPGCTNTSPFGTQTLSNSVGGFATIGCNFAGEYGTWNNAVTGSTYNFTSTIGTDYLTIHTGTPAGPIVAAGTQPLSWVSTVTGTIYVHVNTNSACGTNSSCRDVTGTTTGILCNIAVTASANTNSFCGSGSPTITAVATGNNGAVTYSWNPGGLPGAVINPTVSSTTIYTVTATDATPAGCTATATVLITINPPTAINTAATATTICNGASSTLSATTGTSLTWTENFVGGVTTMAQCATWDAFRASLNPAPYTSCTMSGTFDPVGRTASTPSTVQSIANALKNATPFTMADGGNTWVVGTGCGSGCGGGVVELSADGSTCACITPGYTVRANLVGSNSGGVNTATCGGPTQTITVTFSSLGPLSSYSWAPAASLSCSTCANPIATPAVTTTYTVTGTGSNGCTGTATITVNVINVVASCSGTNVSACNGNNGSASVSPSGGTAPYTFNWSNGASTSSLSSLIAGTYCVTVTDAAGCTGTCCYTVTQPSLAATAVATDASCGICPDGTVSINSITGGTSPYTYSPGNPLTGLLPGVYCITVTDANGCTASACASVSIVGCSLTASCSVNNNVSCNGGSDGSATVTAGGTIVGPLTYLWDNGSTNVTATGLNAGNHLVTVTDQGTGCIATCTSLITQPAGMTVSGSNTNVFCAENTTGSVTISIAGGASPYTFLWSNSAATQNITGVSAGTYTVTVTDANGCTATYSRTVNCTDNIDPVLSAGPGGGTPISENFESGLPLGWTTTGLWHVTNACPQGTPPNPTNWAYYGLDGSCNFDNGTTSGNLTSTTVSIPAAATSATLRFRFVYNGEGGAPPTGFDNASLKVSQNAGAYTQAFAISTAGSFGAWMTANVNMNAFIGSTVSLQWNFSTQDGIGNTGLGLQVDSVRLEYVNIDQCPDDIVATNDPGVCGTTVSWTPPTATDNCTVTLTSNKNPGDFFPIGTTVVTYTATDGCGNSTSCSFNVTVNLVGPPILTLTETHVNADCQGAPTGSIDLTIAGGATPYGYLWSNGASTEDLGSLIVGVYSVTVTEANGCSATLSVSIGDFPPLQTSETHVNILCNGDLTGSIDITAIDGKPGYDYLWSNTATTEDLTAIGAGTYTVTISDQCFSVQTITVTITEPPAFVSAPVENDVTCFGACDGNISLNASGGITPYTYLWSNSETTTGIIGLCPGTYTVLVTDANGCTITGSFNITEPPQVFVTETHVNVSCFLGSNGSIDVTVTGGSPPFSYLWSNGATTEDVSGLNVNTYFVTVTESNGCVSNLTVAISSPTAIVITPTIVNPSSMNINGGSINTSVSGGVPGYTYLWSTGATTSGITGLAAGNYTVAVTDANGCVRPAIYTLILECKLGAINVVNKNASCFKNNGIVTVTGTGGTGYTYQWQTIPVQTTATGTGLNYGKNNYCLITDIASGCTFMDTVVKPHTTSIGVLLSSPAFIGGKNISCNGGTNGSINVAISGDPGPYTFIWNDGATIQNRTGLPAGTYIVTVSTGNPGCKAIGIIVLTQPSVINASATGVNPSCGGNNGSATATASGGVGPYSYSWNSIPVQNTITATGLTVGTYTVTVTDANGCTKTTTKSLTGGAGLAVTAIVSNVKCFGTATGSIDITPSGGNPPYSYLWSNGATTQDQMNKLAIGTYTVVVTDSKGCTGTFSTTITQPPVLDLTKVSANITCNGAQNGTATVTATGGTPPYVSYQWNTVPPKTTASVTGLKPGTWTCLVTDSKGCVKSINVTITQPAVITVSTTKTNVTTFGGNNGTATANASGGVSPYSYIWSTAPPQSTQTATGLTAGVYTVTVTDANGCTKTKSVTITQPSARLLGDDKTEVEASALLYPNPTTGFITITFNEVVQSKISIDIYNFTGALVYSKQVKAESNSNSFNLDLSQLAKGIYTVKYQTGDHDWIDKLVIQ